MVSKINNFQITLQNNGTLFSPLEISNFIKIRGVWGAIGKVAARQQFCRIVLKLTNSIAPQICWHQLIEKSSILPFEFSTVASHQMLIESRRWLPVVGGPNVVKLILGQFPPSGFLKDKINRKTLIWAKKTPQNKFEREFDMTRQKQV